MKQSAANSEAPNQFCAPIERAAFCSGGRPLVSSFLPLLPPRTLIPSREPRSERAKSNCAPLRANCSSASAQQVRARAPEVAAESTRRRAILHNRARPPARPPANSVA